MNRLSNRTKAAIIYEKGVLKSNVNHTYPLSEVSEAHRAIENRETTGATVLIP
jgi:NADPH2:quinone reductase